MRSARILLVATALWAVWIAGCQTVTPNPWGHSSTKNASGTWKKPPSKQSKEPFWSSWFTAEEPPPPKTMKEWMDLEPIRP
jgi:hypothetical protein